MQLPPISPTSDFPFLSVNVQFRQAVDDFHRFQTDGNDPLQQFEWISGLAGWLLVTLKALYSDCRIQQRVHGIGNEFGAGMLALRRFAFDGINPEFSRR